jgi:DNA-binding response OmpR family regulator
MNPGCDVLIVDDEPVVTAAVRMVLRHEGFEVAMVSDVDAALAHPALDTCRLLICDLMLAGRSGLEVLKAARLRRPTLPILMITGYATPAHEELVLSSGATAFLAKPFDDSELLTLVRRALDPTDGAGEEHES